MIAFLDTEVYVIERNLIDKEYINIYFSEESHKEDILLLYENGRYYGMVCYQSLVNDINVEFGEESNREEDSYIIRKTYIHKADDESLWDNLRTVFSNDDVPYVPVFDEMENLLYFAYNKTGKMENLRYVLQNLYECSRFSFFKTINMEIRVGRVYDLNELGFLFWKMAVQKYHMSVETVGEKWRTLYPRSQNGKETESGEEISEQYIAEYYPTIDPMNLIVMDQGNKKTFFIKDIAEKIRKSIIEDNKESLKKKGIKILTAYFGPCNQKTKDEEYRRLMEIEPHMEQRLWNQSDMYKQICKVEGQKISYEEWHAQFDRKQWEYVKIDGTELMKKSFGKERNKIYLIGPCIVSGYSVKSHQESFGWCLYKRMEEMGVPYTVVCIAITQICLVGYEKIFSYLMLSENDIVLVMTSGKDTELESDIPMDQIMDKRPCDWFYNIPLHTNYVGNLALAQQIADNYLVPICKMAKENPKYLQIGREFLNKEENVILEKYIDEIRTVKSVESDKHIGAIVMNCNPMTKGHYYLIEEARKQVDYVYVFVVQENKSEFTFEERFDIVSAETAQMDNVIVVPSGEFVLSYSTMPLYFEKEEKKDAILDAANDLRIFGQYVAPALGITERFVGEEPIDMVTKQYNDEMKKILPSYRIKVTEIPRIKMGDVVVSASRVRALMNAGRWKELQELVTEGVYKRLRERCRNFYES